MNESLRVTLDLIRTQKVRFMLTVSGIVVGVASLIIMASLLEVGLGVLQASSVHATGDDVITVRNDWQQTSNHPDARLLDADDKEAIARSTLLSPGSSVTASYGMASRKVRFDETDYEPMTQGVSAEAFEVYSLAVARGRLFSANEHDSARRVAVLGAAALDGKPAPGDTVRIEGRPYTVVGILAEKADMGPGGAWSWNQRLLVPASTYQLNLDASRDPRVIVVKVAMPAEYVGLVKDYVLATRTVLDAILMRDRTVKSYEFEGVSDDSSTEELIVATIQALLYLTTVFSMIVGGINIMNIMLVTVMERTREIGLRRAVGATQGDIVRQFLAESLLITLAGALIGLVSALVVLALGTLALTTWVTPWPFHVELWSVALGVGFSSAIGLGFGLYPAWRASRLDPVEALRSD